MDFPNVSRSVLNLLIEEWILSERNRKILKRRFLDDIRLEPLAEEFDLSVRQIRRIVTDGKATLKAHLIDE
jgi:DNA-directed RNA polymerase sigma subunit (sigma70/sigma32)